MSELSKSGFSTLYENTSGTFATNSTREVSEADMRQFATDIKQSTLFYQDDYLYYVKETAASGSTTYTIPDTIPNSYVDGERFLITFPMANSGPSTLNRNGLGPKDLLDHGGNALSAGQIPASGTFLARYNGTNWRLVNLNANSATVYSGTYTPTLTNGTNAASSTPQVTQYMRVGNVVTVGGVLSITPTAGAGTLTNVAVSLPIASDFSGGIECGGTCVDGFTSQYGSIIADAANDRVTIEFKAQTTSARNFMFTFTYLIV